MRKEKLITIIFILLLLFIVMVVGGCNNKVENDDSATVKKEPVKKMEDSEHKITFDVKYEISSIQIILPTSMNEPIVYNKMEGEKLEIERTTFKGNKIRLITIFTNDITQSINEELEENTYEKNITIDAIISEANPNIYIDSYMYSTYGIISEITMPFEDMEEKDIDIIIPKHLKSIKAEVLETDTIIPLRYTPSTKVYLQTKVPYGSIENDGASLNFFEVIENGQDYAFDIVFSQPVDEESVLTSVKAAYDKHNARYEWVDDQTITVSIDNIESVILEGIDFTKALDAEGTPIGSIVYFILDVKVD